MYQRLLFLLSVLFISGVSMAQNNDVMTPADGDYVYVPGSSNPLLNPTPATNLIQKWVHDPSQKNRIPSSVNLAYKSYRYNNTSFRLRFPNNYNPANKYPILIFFHGAGEAAPIASSHNSAPTINRENQDQLFWGADSFNVRINRGEWNGFVLFTQVFDNSFAWGNDNGSFQNVNTILDTLEKYNGLDPDRVIAMGLSAGGLGALNYADLYPKRLATCIPSVPEAVKTMIDDIPGYVHIPIFMCAGGLDGGSNGCDPANMFAFQDSYINAGGNVNLVYSANEGHVMWITHWSQRDITSKYLLTNYWNNAHKAQPLLYFQNSSFCTGQPINAKMGLTPGYFQYEWQVDNGSGFNTIAGATSNIYTATQAGAYRVHFKRLSTSNWSGWTPVPVVISTNKCTTDTAFVEHFDYNRDWTGGGEYKPGSFTCQDGIVTSATDGLNNFGSISQDGAGITGGRFLMNSTTSACTYNAGDQVWRNYIHPVNIQQNTTYLLSFSMANQYNFFPDPGVSYSTRNNPSLSTALTATINDVPLTPAGGVKTTGVGNTSWKKFSYIWNSNTTPNNPSIAIINNQTNAYWNDFILDEIMLVKYRPVFPGGALKNFTLWAKANSINGTDGNGVGLWTNNDINGDNLGQSALGALPTYKNNAADNINFNPVVNFSAANGQYMQAQAGFSGSSTHTAVTAYVVAEFNSLTQDDKNIIDENQASGRVVKVTLNSTGKMSWTTGFSGTNTISTPNNTIEVNKPGVWSFSKDNNGTASGNKQDIRKNGIVVATGSATSSFTGNNSPFGLTNGGQFFDGNLAEVVFVYDSAITPLKQNTIESYLALKYGTTLGNTTTPINYTASDSTTVFWTADNKFQNDVFGIGTDSTSGLVQKISNSANSGGGDGTGQSGTGNLVLSTNTDLLDKRFLMIGNSRAALTQHVIVPGESSLVVVGSTRVGRNWKVQNTGAVGAVTLSFDTTGLGNQAGGPAVNKYALLINKNGDTTYPNPVTLFGASSASGKKIIFSGVTLTNGSVFTIITNNLNSALPAVWLGFTAEAVNGNALLNWKTSDEINVAGYTVEHSFNGVSFSAVGYVTANNSTGVNNYTLTNTDLAPGVHYYRIRRTDRDGKSEFSDIKSIKISASGANVQVRPNPVTGSNLALSVSVQQSSKTNVQVMGVDGKIIAQQNINLLSGTNMVNINIATVPPGIYLVRVQLSDEVVTKKFIKER